MKLKRMLGQIPLTTNILQTICFAPAYCTPNSIGLVRLIHSSSPCLDAVDSEENMKFSNRTKRYFSFPAEWYVLIDDDGGRFKKKRSEKSQGSDDSLVPWWN